MPLQNVASIGGFLKRAYTFGIEDQLNNNTTLFGVFDKSSDEVSGEDFIARFSVKYQRNHGIRWITESGDLPDAENAGYIQGTVQLKYVYGTFHLSAQAIEAASKSQSRFANAIDEAIADLILGFSIEQERSCFGNGSGSVAQFNQADGVVVAGTPIAIDNPGARGLEAGMILEQFDALSGGTQITPFDTSGGNPYAIIASVDRRNDTIKFVSDVDVRNNGFLFRGNLFSGNMLLPQHFRRRKLC